MKLKLADKIRSLWRKHRLSLRDERDNKELWYMYISPLSIAAGFIALILVLFIVILSTVAYTPLLEFLPGYQGNKSRTMLMENIVRLDLKEYSAVSDYFVLCTATSEPHIRAIAERIQRDVLEQLKVKPLHVDGSPESHWMIVDFGTVMVHIMDEDTRALYQLESLWGDAPKTDAIKRIEAKIKRKSASEKKKTKEA